MSCVRKTCCFFAMLVALCAAVFADQSAEAQNSCNGGCHEVMVHANKTQPGVVLIFAAPQAVRGKAIGPTQGTWGRVSGQTVGYERCPVTAVCPFYQHNNLSSEGTGSVGPNCMASGSGPKSACEPE